MDEIDPIEELHKTRRKLIAKAGGTLDAYIRHIMEDQKKNPRGLVDFSKSESAQNKPLRKSTKPAKASTRKTGLRRKAVAP